MAVSWQERRSRATDQSSLRASPARLRRTAKNLLRAVSDPDNRTVDDDPRPRAAGTTAPSPTISPSTLPLSLPHPLQLRALEHRSRSGSPSPRRNAAMPETEEVEHGEPQ